MPQASRIDSLDSTILRMADGNASALRILAEIATQDHSTKPSMGIAQIKLLDQLRIYGTNIHVLHKDKCGGDPDKFQILLRAVLLGRYPASKVREMAADQFNQAWISDAVWKELEHVLGRS